MVFTEFIEMVEEVFSPETADKILTMSELPSGGVYTALGAYDHNEMVTLVKNLSAETNTPVPDLLRAFGKYLFSRFSKSHPQFFAEKSDTFTFLSGVDNYIHVEVRKLYPDAELPKFTYERPSDDTLVMVYSSSRPFADLAEGLIQGCAEHFGENVSVERRLISNDPTTVEFSLSRRVAV